MREPQFSFFCLIVTLFCTTELLSQEETREPKWSIEISDPNPIVGDTIELNFKARLDSNWYLFSTRQPTCQDSILVSLKPIFSFRPTKSFAIYEPIIPVNSKLMQDDYWPCEVEHFKYTAHFKVKMKVMEFPLKIEGQIFYTVFGFEGTQFIPYLWNWEYTDNK